MDPTWSNDVIGSILSMGGISLTHMDINNWAPRRKDALFAVENL